MEQLIANYLFQNKSCPLPAIGKLTLSEKPAHISHGAKLIEPPQPIISLVAGDYSANDFLNYICAVEKIENDEAGSRLSRFCNQLQSLDSFSESKIPGTGKFYVDAEGNLVFKQAPLPNLYRNSLHAEKVIRPDATHSLLVGDKESNSTLMTEYYNVDEPVPKSKWWIAALLLALTGLAVICLYYFNETNAGVFGNASKPALHEGTQTYSGPK